MANEKSPWFHVCKCYNYLLFWCGLIGISEVLQRVKQNFRSFIWLCGHQIQKGDFFKIRFTSNIVSLVSEPYTVSLHSQQTELRLKQNRWHFCWPIKTLSRSTNGKQVCTLVTIWFSCLCMYQWSFQYFLRYSWTHELQEFILDKRKTSAVFHLYTLEWRLGNSCSASSSVCNFSDCLVF